MKFIKTLFFVGLMFIIFFTMPENILAQPFPEFEPEQTPIDGGLGILAALGGAYAIKKLRNKE